MELIDKVDIKITKKEIESLIKAHLLSHGIEANHLNFNFKIIPSEFSARDSYEFNDVTGFGKRIKNDAIA